MVDTRPAMTTAEFEQRVSNPHPRWWTTGEELIHVPAVMSVEGWDGYRHPGNALLAEPQRVLMMWSDLVGQVSNGGFTQFVDNFENVLELSYRLISKLEWPDLLERFDRAFREQAGDPSNPMLARSMPADPAKYSRLRAKAIRGLARAEKRFWQTVTPDDLARAEVDYEQFLMDYDLPIEWTERPSDEAEAFTHWFYTDATKVASHEWIGAYIRANRDLLCRIEG